VNEEALFLRLPLRVAIRKRFQRGDAPIAGLSDRREEKGLLDPAARIGHEVHACDERRVVRGWSSGQVCRAGKEMRRPVLKGAKEAPVVIEVERAPLTPLLFRPLDPPVLGRCPVAP
jgi:hypothetical protein